MRIEKLIKCGLEMQSYHMKKNYPKSSLYKILNENDDQRMISDE